MLQTLRSAFTARAADTSDARYRAIIDTAVDAIVVIDSRGIIHSFNPAAERIFGYDTAEVLGRNVALLMPAPHRGAHDGYLGNYLTTGNARIIGFGREVTGRRKDGSEFPLDLSIAEWQEAGHRYFTGIMRDITLRKEAEAALARAKEEAERANLAKSKFLAAASHDLRQPVQSLVFFAAALSGKLPEGPARAMLHDMERALDALTSLLDGLLDISKLDAGVISARHLPLTIGSVLSTIDLEFARIAAAKDLEFRIVPSGATVKTDPVLLTRMVRNLVANAVRYTNQGRILVGCRHRGTHLAVQVWDTGIGIPPNQLDEIFEEFVQVDIPERDHTLGLGLGLAIVKRLGRLLHHPVEVRSAPGRGSVFSILVPLTSAEPAVAGRPRRSGDDQRGLIVIIDDEQIILRSLTGLLEGWGFEVVAAGSTEEAIALLEGLTRPPNVIVADYRLREGHTGTDAIHRIRTRFGMPIPSVVLTGDTAPERLRDAEASGFSILHKPVQPPVLKELLSETLRSTGSG